MPTDLSSPVETTKPKKKMLSYGAFGVSVVVHLFLLMMVGGVVLIEQAIPRAPFEMVPSVESEAPAATEEEPTQAEEPVPTDMPVTETKAAAADNGQLSAVPEMITTDSNLNFSVASPLVTSTVSALPGTGSGTTGAGAGAAGNGGSRPATKLTIFGGNLKTAEAMEAVFYDTKQGKNGKPMSGGMKYSDVVLDFVSSGFRPEKLSKYFKAEPLYPTRVAIPFTSSAEAVKAFDVVGKATPTDWIVHYHGQFKAPKTATYRFAGYGDDFLYMAIDGKLVLDGCHELLKGNPSALGKGKYPNSEAITGWMGYGKWVDLVAGQSYDFDVVIGDYGASFGVVLCVQEKGVDYAKDAAGRLILPLFRTDKVEIEKMGRYTIPANGPVFAP